MQKYLNQIQWMKYNQNWISSLEYLNQPAQYVHLSASPSASKVVDKQNRGKRRKLQRLKRKNKISDKPQRQQKEPEEAKGGGGGGKRKKKRRRISKVTKVSNQLTSESSCWFKSNCLNNYYHMSGMIVQFWGGFFKNVTSRFTPFLSKF